MLSTRTCHNTFLTWKRALRQLDNGHPLDSEFVDQPMQVRAADSQTLRRRHFVAAFCFERVGYQAFLQSSDRTLKSFFIRYPGSGQNVLHPLRQKLESKGWLAIQ